MKGKSGPKVQAQDIRDSLYQWLVDVLTALKGLLPISMLIAKAEELQEKWIEENQDQAKNYKKVSTIALNPSFFNPSSFIFVFKTFFG